MVRFTRYTMHRMSLTLVTVLSILLMLNSLRSFLLLFLATAKLDMAMYSEEVAKKAPKEEAWKRNQSYTGCEIGI